MKFWFLFLFLLSSSPYANSFFPGPDDFLMGLLRQSQVELDNLKGSSLIKRVSENCRSFRFINPQSGVLEKEIQQCAFINNSSSRLEERVFFSSEGVTLYTLSKITEKTSMVKKRASLNDLLELRFSFGDGTFSANERYDIQVKNNRKTMLLSSRYFRYHFSIIDQEVRGIRKISYERQCSWCSAPSQIEVQYHDLGLRYYSDQAPGLEVTPRLFQEALAQMYYQTVNWLSQELAYPLGQELPGAIPRF